MPKYFRVWLLLNRDNLSVEQVARMLYPDKSYWIAKRIVLKLNQYAEKRIVSTSSELPSTMLMMLPVFYNPSHYMRCSADRPMIAEVKHKWGKSIIVFRDPSIADAKRGARRNIFEICNLARIIYDEVYPRNMNRVLWDTIAGLIHTYGHLVEEKVWVAKRRRGLYVKVGPRTLAFLYIVFTVANRKVLKHDGPKHRILAKLLEYTGQKQRFWSEVKGLVEKLWFLLV